MLSIRQALQHVLEHATPLPAVEVDVRNALGCVLAADILSDIDSPPHDKSLVDGYAVLSKDLANGTVELEVLEEVTAGQTPSTAIGSGQSTRMMTGAPIPQGADAVVMVEYSQQVDQRRVRLQDQQCRAGRNILPRGVSMRVGETVLRRGQRVRAMDIGLLCEVGRAQVPVVPRPKVAVLSTGNELVPADQTPPPGMIRNTNGPMLAACVRQCGAEAIELGIARDDPAELAARIRRGLEADVLILSGGVSAGVLDLVPAALGEQAVEEVFHKVRLKPGKPLWFGVRRETGSERLVFGLPGNPISGFVCFQLFVRPAIDRLADRQSPSPPAITAQLGAAFQHRGDRPTYHPAVLDRQTDPPTVTPTNWQGSADLRGFAAGNSLAVFPAGDKKYVAGEPVEVLPLRNIGGQ